MSDLLHTAVTRWYVLVFLLSFLGLASFHWGVKRSFKLLLIGYAVAWASEASSIRNGFPYGWYRYHYEAMPNEIFLAGVPVWDSLSYAFLCFAGWMMALFIRSRWNHYTPLSDLQASWKMPWLGAALTMGLDIVIDPVAKLGRLWFLGDIYSYPSGGWYFGVPLSNFGGWFLTAWVILAMFRLSDKLINAVRSPASVRWGAAFFWGIFLFNLGIAVSIKAYAIAAASAGWGLLIAAFCLGRKKRRIQPL